MIRIPPDVKALDLITFFFAYHDVTYMPVDRARDEPQDVRGAKPRRLSDHCRSFGAPRRRHHRGQDPASHRGERAGAGKIEAAGFKLVDEGNFLRHPEDPRDAAVFRPQVPVDEFVLKYQKP